MYLVKLYLSYVGKYGITTAYILSYFLAFTSSFGHFFDFPTHKLEFFFLILFFSSSLSEGPTVANTANIGSLSSDFGAGLDQ